MKNASVSKAEIEYQRLSPLKYGTKLNSKKLVAANPKTVKIQLTRMLSEVDVNCCPKIAKINSMMQEMPAAMDNVILKCCVLRFCTVSSPFKNFVSLIFRLYFSVGCVARKRKNDSHLNDLQDQ